MRAGKIVDVGPANSINVPPDAQRIDVEPRELRYTLNALTPRWWLPGMNISGPLCSVTSSRNTEMFSAFGSGMPRVLYASTWDFAPSGLLGPVKLIPMKKVLP